MKFGTIKRVHYFKYPGGELFQKDFHNMKGYREAKGQNIFTIRNVYPFHKKSDAIIQ